MFLGLSLIMMNSCEDLESLNEDTKGFASVVPSALMTKAQVSYMDFLTNSDPNRNNFRKYAQHWTNNEFTQEDNYDQDARQLGATHETNLYRDVITELVVAKGLIEDEVVSNNKLAEQKNQIAILEVQIIMAYQTLVDLFGDIPYSESLDPIAFPRPKFDDAETIYLDLADRLDVAINDFDETEGSFGSEDLIYGGNVANWKSLANSVKLKMGLHLDDAGVARGQTMVEAAYTSGVISDNAGNGLLNFYEASGERNPIFLPLTQEQHYQPTEFLVDEMNSRQDPRMDIFFNPASKIGGVYVGYPYAAGGANYANASNTNIDVFRDPTLPGVLFDAAETSFLLADAAERGFAVGLTTEAHYNAGITATMEYWGVASSDITTYLARADVAFATAAGTDREKIAFQLWLAYYNRGFEAWTEYRRLGAPALVAPPTAVAEANGEVPSRNIYSHLSQTLNKANYDAASAAIGGDLMTTRIFWDNN